jgi:predicted transcriptional regulator
MPEVQAPAAETATAAAKAPKKAPAKKGGKAAPAKKGGKAAPAKAPKAEASARGATREAAVAAVLKALKARSDGRLTRTDLKAKAPYSNYSALMAGMAEAGLIKETKHEGEMVRYVEITAKGRKG